MTTCVERTASRPAANGMMVHKAQVVWGALASASSGAVYARSGALTEVPYSLATRFGPNVSRRASERTEPRAHLTLARQFYDRVDR